MRKRILIVFVAVLNFISIISGVSFAADTSEYVVFFNKADNTAITAIGNAGEIYAKISLDEEKPETAVILIAKYDNNERLLEIVNGFETDGDEIKTNSISPDGAKTVKVFALDGFSNMKPILSKTIGIEADKMIGADNADKFKAKTELIFAQGKTVNVGDIFSGENVVSKYTDVAFETVSGTARAVFNEKSETWTEDTITFSGEGTVKVLIKDYYFCNTAEALVEVVAPQDRYSVVFENTENYLYRAGNQNALKLESLFDENEGVTAYAEPRVEVTNIAGNAKGTFTKNDTIWTDGTIKFSGTGVVNVTIKDEFSNPVDLKLEIVDATNVTAYSELENKNSVLLNDIEMSSNSSYKLSNATLYGNGFTFDVTNGAYSGAGTAAKNYLILLQNSTLDNVKIVGAVYTEYGSTSASDYNRATVLSMGNDTIANSYISNCACPVRMINADLEIINSTLKGGNFANLDIQNGHVILDNVTTINQVNANDTASDGTVVVGLGVVVYYEGVLSSTTVEVKNGITQYNNISDSQAAEYITNSTASQLANEMFGTAYKNLQYSDGSNTWVNTGIVSMTDAVGDSNISDVDGYSEASVKFSGKSGYVHTKVPTADDITAVVPEYVTYGQYAIAPKYSFDYTSKNYMAKTEGSNDYCYYDNGTVLISMDEGDTVNWDTSILAATKADQTLDYSVSMDGTDYTGKSIAFSKAGDYTLTYTYTDDNNYASDGVTKYSKTYTKNVYISVSVVKPNAKNAEFTFGSSNTPSRVVTIGNDTYVMPNVTATSDTIGSKTISGTTVYYPILEAYSSDGKTEHSSVNFWYMCFPVFKNAVTITDYVDGGTGDAVIYNSSTTALPSGLSAENPSTTFQYSSSPEAPEAPVNEDGVLCYTSPELSNNARNEMTVVAKYTYKDNAGATYYYYIGYHCPEMTVSSSCITPDTKIMLSDGGEKRIDELTYEDELLVWNFYKGDYDRVSPAIIFEHGYGNNTVIELRFEDGTEIKAVNLHQFFDITDNKFVNISKDTVASLVGHSFAKTDGEGYKEIRLTDYEIREEYIEAFGVISANHYNVILEGMLTTDFEVQDVGLFNYFEVGNNLTFNQEKMKADIEEYGLYTYEDFENYLSPELFEAFNVKYMKVAVGKGQFTYEGIIELIGKWL